MEEMNTQKCCSRRVNFKNSDGCGSGIDRFASFG